ncbi:MAG: 6-carboxytetrahydropterin synthase QueD [Raoultibacter sp.]
MLEAILHSDGGSRGNPGPAGCGFELLDATTGDVLALAGTFLGTASNNVAEYSALVWGMQNALAAGVQHLSARADSELMVKQMLGAYKVKSADLKPLFLQARSLAAQFSHFDIQHVYRSDNKEADAMANAAMDAKAAVGTFLVAYESQPLTLFDDDAAAGTAAAAAAAAASFPQTEPAPAQVPSPAPVQPKGTPMYELMVKDHFDAAHALPGYDGPCQYLHGHTWDVEVIIAGTQLDEVGLLYDFKTIKTDLHAILDAYDHHYINDVPPFDTINPTAEHLSRVLFERLAQTLPPHITLKEVAVWESPIAKVTYRLD